MDRHDWIIFKIVMKSKKGLQCEGSRKRGRLNVTRCTKFKADLKIKKN